MIVNGKEFKRNNEKTIIDLLVTLNINPEVVVVEQNGIIIGKENFKITEIQDEDAIEVVSFVGGG